MTTPSHDRRRSMLTRLAPLLLVLPIWVVLSLIGATTWSAFGAVVFAVGIFAVYLFIVSGEAKSTTT